MFEKTYWKIADGRVWCAEDGAFAAPPETATVMNLKGPGGEAATVDDLKEVIAFYRERGRDFPLGALAAPDDRVKQFEAAVTQRLDAFARERQYDNMDKARLASLTADFKADGDCANQLYDQVWGAAFALEDQIRAGSLSVDDALAQLPAMTWSAA